MARQLKQNFILFFLILLISVAFGFGVWFGKAQVICPVCPPEDVDFSLLWETWDLLERRYVNQENLDIQEMVYGAISGMVESLDDPYTVFLKPEETKRFIEDVTGTFEGVGMEIGIREEQLQVIAPLEGTPAQKAGLRAGDRITGINGDSTIDITIEEAVDLIRGEKGTEVILTIYREEWKETRDVTIVRDIIEVPSLKWELMEDNIAYVKIYHFSEKASTDFQQAAIKILESPAEKIILDLRNNPGGYLEVTNYIAGWFLEKGNIVVIEDFGGDLGKKNYTAQGNAKLASYPLVILINQGSASGSEILAGAIRDNREVKLVGETSFGKGSVQELERLKTQEGASVKLTIANWLTPKGELITDKGLEPDIEVEITEEDYAQDRDPQLDKAIEIAKDL